ncbi:hypothetical protein Dsin_027200 [Dipteronia sinensis]|uniref:Reticulon-like protein n=1 Tax=Dipteronia sinensis TaxID=43782 RepID=A0AAD9ZZ19_9ROSI|nr:hypothetical protein Dsin_027200 [Dipteronia sinensis]
MGDSHSSGRISVHHALGGGYVADVLLWKKWCGGVVLLVSATTLWFLFEQAGYNLLSFVSNVLLLLVVILFLWGKSASLLNRPLPPLPDLQISDKTVVKAADAMRVWVNSGLSIARDVAVGRNLRIFLQVAFVLLVVSYIGSLFNFLTLVYIGEFSATCVLIFINILCITLLTSLVLFSGILLSLSVPVVYDKYQNHIDEKLCIITRVVSNAIS